jgi:hypothetical protein
MPNAAPEAPRTTSVHLSHVPQAADCGEYQKPDQQAEGYALGEIQEVGDSISFMPIHLKSPNNG